MPKSEAKKRADAKYNKKAYYRPTIYLRREHEEALHKKATEKGMTVSSYLKDLILKDIGMEG